ncbi:MAG: hypothetical protein ABI652_04555 [Acidobacteriota bacterium]
MRAAPAGVAAARVRPAPARLGARDPRTRGPARLPAWRAPARARDHMTLAERVRDAALTLEGAGFDADVARRDAALLARATLGWDAARWVADQRDPATADFTGAFAAWVTRRRPSLRWRI